jgi:tRNA(fMet)-specific endonuclease VapC
MGPPVTAGYLLDTNHVTKAINKGSPERMEMRRLLGKGVRVGICVPVLCEVESGIWLVSRPEEYRASLAQLLAQVWIWPIDRATAKAYGEIYNDLRRRGRVLSQVDMMLAALARQMKLTLVTTDRDFDALPDLRVENWTNRQP